MYCQVGKLVYNVNSTGRNYGVVVALHSHLRFENGVIPDGAQTLYVSRMLLILFENGVIPDKGKKTALLWLKRCFFMSANQR